MSRFRGKVTIGLVCSLLVGSFISCGGSGTNNDQGTSFLALGYYTLDANDQVVPLGAVRTPLFADTPIFFANQDGADLYSIGGSPMWIGLQNLLTSQFIRVTRVVCSYDIAGAAPGFSVPDDSTQGSFVLGQAEGDEVTGSDETPIQPQVVYFPIPLVSTDIFAYLNNNQEMLPELPFTSTVTCTAIGVSRAGDVFETNPVSIPVVFTDLSECCTGAPGFQNGPGTGGTIDTFSDNVLEDTESSSAAAFDATDVDDNDSSDDSSGGSFVID